MARDFNNNKKGKQMPIKENCEHYADTYNTNIAGTSVFDDVTIGGAATVAETLAVTGVLTATGGVVGDVTGDVTGAITGAKAAEVVTTTNVITAAESGKTFYLNAASGFVSTLPAPALGLHYRFVIGVTPPSSGNHTVVTNGNATIIQGNVLHNPTDDAGTRGDDEDTISFVASQAVEGDWVEVESDGTNWYVRGQSNVTEGITLTDAA